MYRKGDQKSVPCREVVPFLESPLSEVPLSTASMLQVMTDQFSTKHAENYGGFIECPFALLNKTASSLDYQKRRKRD